MEIFLRDEHIFLRKKNSLLKNVSTLFTHVLMNTSVGKILTLNPFLKPKCEKCWKLFEEMNIYFPTQKTSLPNNVRNLSTSILQKTFVLIFGLFLKSSCLFHRKFFIGRNLFPVKDGMNIFSTKYIFHDTESVNISKYRKS